MTPPAAFEDDWHHADVVRLRPGEHLVRTGADRGRLCLDVMPVASISGTVHGAGRPLAQAVVTVSDAATGRAVAATIAAARGRYLISPLRMAGYKVRASKPGWVSEYANDQPSLTRGHARLVLTGEHVNGGETDWPHLDLARRPWTAPSFRLAVV